MDVLEHQHDETPDFWSMVEGDFPRPQAGRSALPPGPGLRIALKSSTPTDLSMA